STTAWQLSGNAVLTPGLLTMTAPSVCGGGVAISSVVIPDGNHHALDVQYTLVGDDADAEVQLEFVPHARLAPATSGDAHICLDPRAATEVLPVMLRMTEP